MHLSNTKKKNIIIVELITFCLLLSLAVSFAFLWDQKKIVNKVSVGNNYTEIVEKYDPPEMMEEGKSYTKEVSVINKDNPNITNKTVPCYVRVFAEVEDPDVAENLDIDFNTTDWTEKQADGYYYYKKVLGRGETTTPLFTTLTAKKDINDFRMICYEESVQSEGFSSAKEAFDAIK